MHRSPGHTLLLCIYTREARKEARVLSVFSSRVSFEGGFGETTALSLRIDDPEEIMTSVLKFLIGACHFGPLT